MSITLGDPEVAVTRLRRAKRVLITCHANPDGDALGSELALTELADRLGVDYVVTNHDPTPLNLSRLPGIERIAVAPELPTDFPDGFDLAITLECSSADRCGFVGIDRLPILNIDHHKSNDRFGEVNFLDSEAPAVGEMVLKMFDCAQIQPSAQAATNMYAALATDTGDFRYSNATSRAFRAATSLVEAGAAPAQVAEWVHEHRSLATVRLLGEAMRTLEVSSQGRLATIAVDRAAFDRAGATPADTEEIVNLPRSIAGVEAVAFFKQWEEAVVRVSLRSKGALDVATVAARFGGGGHTNAAGCTLNDSLDRVRVRVTQELKQLLENAS